MNKQLFGAYVAENRKRLGMTQTQLAARLHVTDKAVSKWERGLSYPDVTLLEPLAEALSVSIDALLRCRMPADEGKEQTMTEERSSEPIQTVMEISKETVQKKKLGSKLLAAALAVVIAAAGVLVIPRAVREYRAAQEAKHHHEVNCAKVDMLYVEQMPGSENSGEYICVVGYEGKLLYLHYDGGLSDKELLPPDRIWENFGNIIFRPGIEWTQSYLRFTYDDRTGGGELTGIVGQTTQTSMPVAVDNIETEKPLFDLENTCLMREGNGNLLFYRPSEHQDGARTLYDANIFFRLPKTLADIGYTIADCDGDGVNELLVKTDWDYKPLVAYDYADGQVTSTWYDTLPDWAAAVFGK